MGSALIGDPLRIHISTPPAITGYLNTRLFTVFGVALCLKELNNFVMKTLLLLVVLCTPAFGLLKEVPSEKWPSWKQKFEARRAEFQEEVQQELSGLKQQFADKQAEFEVERQKLRDTVDRLYNEAEKKFQAKVSEWEQNPGKGKAKPAGFAIEIAGDQSMDEVIRTKYEGNKDSLEGRLNSELDKLYPGFQETAEAYAAQQAEVLAARKEKFDEFKAKAAESLNETKQSFEEFAQQANEKLKADWETKKAEHAAKKEHAKEVMGNVKETIKNGTHMILDKIKAQKEAKAAANLQMAQWISDRMKNKTAEWKAKHPLAAARSISDVTNFLNQASGASGWQTASTIYMIICFLVTIGLLVLIFRQLKARAPYERLDGGNVHAPNPLAQQGYNPNFGNSNTFVPTHLGARKDQLF
ncbi:unnamed protein product, partial [Mesorhabditis spiculigera]